MKRGRQGRIAAWWAMRSQKRRRRGQVEPPAAPVITAGWYEWGATQEGWADVVVTFTFEHGAFPVAMLQVWSVGGVEPYLLATVPSSDTTYRHERVSETETEVIYKLRYVSGSVVGPFSAPFVVNIEV